MLNKKILINFCNFIQQHNFKFRLNNTETLASTFHNIPSTTMTDKEKSTIQEQLATLYLRLNGYFTTGYIIHSGEKKIEGELDILAVRFPLHKQDDTEHNSSEYLELAENIDIIIAEVKSKRTAFTV